MAKLQHNPSKAGVSAASVKGNAGPNNEQNHNGKRNSQNSQFKRD